MLNYKEYSFASTYVHTIVLDMFICFRYIFFYFK
jgi:hypothetical protein